MGRTICSVPPTKEDELPFLSISRQMGALGDEIASLLADRLGWELITRNEAIDRFLAADAKPGDRHLLRDSARHFLALSPSGLTFMESIESGLRAYLRDHSAVLVGFGSQFLFADDRCALHVRVVAPLPVRVLRTRQRFHVPPEEARRILGVSDRKQRRFVSTVFCSDLEDPAVYHLSLNTGFMTVEEAVTIVLALVEKHRARIALEDAAAENDPGLGKRSQTPDGPPVFRHPSEAEFARILDMYGIEWSYEPRTFPTEWDAEGNVVQAFRPDFHLTRFGTYIELTTMDQRHVTEKNQKLKRVRELYPDIDVRIVYRRDFHNLLERFRTDKGG